MFVTAGVYFSGAQDIGLCGESSLSILGLPLMLTAWALSEFYIDLLSIYQVSSSSDFLFFVLAVYF